jgi:hypothetical protein
VTFPPDAHTDFQDFQGKSASAVPGDIVPVADIVYPSPDDFVQAGLGVFEGDQDGGSFSAYAMLRDVRALALRYGILQGNPDDWSMQNITDAMNAAQATDAAAIVAYAEAVAAAEQPIETGGDTQAGGAVDSAPTP